MANGLAANYAAYEAEVHRAGLEAVPAVQWDAARALGLTRAQAIRHVIAPQGVRIAMPAIINDLNSLIKDSCLVSVIGVTDLLGNWHERRLRARGFATNPSHGKGAHP